MPSPSNLYALYTADEVAAELVLLKAEISGGQITSLGGAAKSSSFQQIPADQKMASLLLRMRQLGLTPPRAQKVLQVLSPMGAVPCANELDAGGPLP
jgi:hypothetical protein